MQKLAGGPASSLALEWFSKQAANRSHPDHILGSIVLQPPLPLQEFLPLQP